MVAVVARVLVRVKEVTTRRRFAREEIWMISIATCSLKTLPRKGPQPATNAVGMMVLAEAEALAEAAAAAAAGGPAEISSVAIRTLLGTIGAHPLTRIGYRMI